MMKLKRELSLVSTTFAGVGIIVGAGIYVIIGAAAGLTGNTVWLAFLFAAIVAALTGLSFAELSSMFPTDAGEYRYAEKAFGKRIAFVTGILVLFAGIISAAAVSIGFAGYFARLFNTTYTLLVAIIIIAVLSWINHKSIKDSSNLNIIFTVVEVGALLGIIIFGFLKFKPFDALHMTSGFSGVLQSAALIFFAYSGFESIVKLSEETKQPEKTIPRAIVLSIIITTTLYLLVAIAAVSAIGWETLAASTAPLADVARMIMGSNAFLLVAIVALFSTANTVLVLLVTASRMLYGMGEYVKKLHVFTCINKKTRTPTVAILVTAILAGVFALVEHIDAIASMANFAVFASFIAVNGALIKLRYEGKKGKFVVPLHIKRIALLPVLGIVTSVIMLFFLDKYAIIFGVGILVVSFLAYEWTRTA